MQGMRQAFDEPPVIIIADYELESVHDFVYLSSTISDISLSWLKSTDIKRRP